MSFFGGFTLGLLNGRRHRGSGGGGGGGFTPQALGFNLINRAYYEFQDNLVDIIQGGGVYFNGTGFNVASTTTLNSTSVSVADATNIRVGMAVSGAGIQGSTTVEKIVGTTVTISFKATASGSPTLTFTFNGCQVPKEYRDTNGFPNAMGPGCTAIQVYLNSIPSAAQYKLLYTGSAGTITFKPDTVQAGATFSAGQAVITVPAWTSGSIVYFTYTNPGITAWSCRPTTDPGGYTTSQFRSELTSVKGTGPIREMHNTFVESNLHPTGISDPSHNFSFSNLKFPQNGDGNLTENLLTATNRNTPSSADWWQHLDGTPHEIQIQMATEIGTDWWVNIHWNIDGTDSLGNFTSSTYLSGDGTNPGVASLWAAFAASTGHYVYLENSNEVWNAVYTVMHQCVAEAAALGITAPQRYAQKAKQVFDAFAAAFNAAGCGPANGSANRLVRTLCWQNGGGSTPTDLQAMVTLIGASSVDALSVAGYYGCDTTTYPATYTGATAPVIASMYAIVDSTITSQLAAKAVADSNGLKFARYEGGRGDTFNDQTFLNSLDADAGGHDVMAYYLNEDRRRIGKTIPLAYHDFIDRLTTGSAGSFGLLHSAIDVVSSSPKASAVAEAMLGNFTMTDVRLPSSSIVHANSPAGTIVGTLSGFLPEAALSIVDASGWFTVDSSGNITTTGVAMTSGAHSVSVVQTPNAGITVTNGPTKTTSGISLTIDPAVPIDTFSVAGSPDATQWGATTAAPINLGVTNSGVSVANSGGSLVLTFTGTTGSRGACLPYANTLDLSQNTTQLWNHSGGTNVGRDHGVCFYNPFSLVTTGNTHTSTTLDGLANTTGVAVGMLVTGTGIPTNTFVTAINSGTSVTLSQAATGTASISVTFTWAGFLIDRAAGTTNVYRTNGTSSVSNMGSKPTRTDASWPWMRYRILNDGTGGNTRLHIDHGPSTASNAPLETDWSKDDIVVDMTANHLPTSGLTWGPYIFNQFGSTAGDSVSFGSFNMAA